jgi:hypothetical protein
MIPGCWQSPFSGFDGREGDGFRQLHYVFPSGPQRGGASTAGVPLARVKSAKSIGVRSGNWFTPRQAPGASERAGHHDDQGLRDRAVIAVLLRCGGFTPEATVAVHGTRIRRFLTLSALQRDSCNTAGWQGGIRRITA